MSEKEQKKSGGLVALVVLLLIVTIVSAILATYAWAKYTSSGEGNAVAEVAKWNVTFSDNKSSFTGTYSHVANGKVAPGTKGSFNITVNPNNTEVSFGYTIKVTGVKLVKITEDTENEGSFIETELADDTVLNPSAVAKDQVTANQVLSHITFKDGAIDNAEATELGSGTGAVNSTITGTYTHNGTSGSFDAGTKTISWNWPYSTTGEADVVAAYDLIDTVAGEYAAGKHDAKVKGLKFKIEYEIVATQLNPAG